MPDASHTIREEIHGVVLFVGAIWLVYLISLVFPRVDQYGVIPRTAGGLVGIAAMPFLHANFSHLLSNTVPLVVLLILLAEGSRARVVGRWSSSFQSSADYCSGFLAGQRCT